mmetsp:Transcript_20538/g.64620  ORF Transcript_20538/g.64620 Transcript_20538/m.64620 type:complete len:90 (-) Transcript_20538:459-728(-)
MATYGATTTDEKRETSSGRRAPAAAIAAALVVLAVASSSGVSLKPTLRGEIPRREFRPAPRRVGIEATDCPSGSSGRDRPGGQRRSVRR